MSKKKKSKTTTDKGCTIFCYPLSNDQLEARITLGITLAESTQFSLDRAAAKNGSTLLKRKKFTFNG